ncbi:MAG: hypothetical protein N4A61_15820 [Pelagimonas sp.]|jgi:hypothetical protein|nr:hypothetical protein [Pelagimonas sp.]
MSRPLTFAVCALIAVPQTLPAQSAPETCFCINRGQEKVPLGGVRCLRVGDNHFLAQCQMSLNLLTWRKLQEGCPSSRLTPVTTPAKSTPQA